MQDSFLTLTLNNKTYKLFLSTLLMFLMTLVTLSIMISNYYFTRYYFSIPIQNNEKLLKQVVLLKKLYASKNGIDLRAINLSNPSPTNLSKLKENGSNPEQQRLLSDYENLLKEAYLIIDTLIDEDQKNIGNQIQTINKLLNRQQTNPNIRFNPTEEVDVSNAKLTIDLKNNFQGGIFYPFSPTPPSPQPTTTNTPNHPVVVQQKNTTYAKIKNYFNRKFYYYSLPVGWPVKDIQNNRFTSAFGQRKDPFNHKDAFHSGLDIVNDSNRTTPIIATGNGFVSKAEYHPAYGYYVEIDHKNGFFSRYAHLSKITVNKFDFVTKNQLIGNMGSTGRATGPHLHYEIIFNDKLIDPKSFIAIK